MSKRLYRSLPWALLLPSLFSATWYVNPDRADRSGDGRSPETAFTRVADALARCQSQGGDEIKVAPGPNPIREEIFISGKKYDESSPLIIDFGNRWIIGTEPVNGAKWISEGGGRWRYPGYLRECPLSFFVLNGRAVTMGRGRIWPEWPLPSPEALEVWQWTTVGEDVVFRLPQGIPPAQVGIERGARATGVSFGGAASTGVTIRRARVKFVTNDGFNLHGPREGAATKGIRFEDVRSDFNWDQGISSHDGCESVVEDAIMIGNRAGLVHIDRSRTTHRRLLLAEGGRFDLFFYGNAAAVFEDSYVFSTTADRNLRFWEKSKADGATFVFSNSVFEQSPLQTNAWSFALGGIDFSILSSTFWLDGAGVLEAPRVDGTTHGRIERSLLRSRMGAGLMNWGAGGEIRLETTLMDEAGIGLGVRIYRPGEGKELRASGMSDTRSGFCRRLDPGPFAGSERLEGVGAALPREMAEKVRRYRTGELMGAGFAFLSGTREGTTATLRFNRCVDPLSLPGGIRIERRGQPVTVAMDLSGTGHDLRIRDLEPEDVVQYTDELRSDLGPIGLRNPGRL